MAAVVRAGQTSVGFWLLSCTFVFQSAAVPGGRFSNPPTSQSPVRCASLYRTFPMTNIYDILLDNKIIGTTELEKADAPMGVVFGKLTFINIESGYHFFKTYCQTNNIKIVTDYPNDKLITTEDIPNLKVINQNGIEIKGQGTNIEGMDSDVF